jgi:hypothetical protein
MKLKSLLFESSMEISNEKKIGDVTEPSIKPWKKSPGDFTSACQAAAVYAKKFGEDMVVLPGNSYGSRVFQIVKKTEPISKYIPGTKGKTVRCGIVTPTGEVFMADAKEL